MRHVIIRRWQSMKFLLKLAVCYLSGVAFLAAYSIFVAVLAGNDDGRPIAHIVFVTLYAPFLIYDSLVSGQVKLLDSAGVFLFGVLLSCAVTLIRSSR